jgi:hypothetical protein
MLRQRRVSWLNAPKNRVHTHDGEIKIIYIYIWYISVTWVSTWNWPANLYGRVEKQRYILSLLLSLTTLSHLHKLCHDHDRRTVNEFKPVVTNFNTLSQMPLKSRDSSVGIALGYGLGDRGSRVRFLAGAGNHSLHHGVQNSSGAHPASYSMGTRGSFPRGKAAGAWSLSPTSI